MTKENLKEKKEGGTKKISKSKLLKNSHLVHSKTVYEVFLKIILDLSLQIVQ